MSTIFNSKIFAQEAMKAFVANLFPFRAFSTDMSGEAAKKGDAIIVPLVSSLTGTTFSNYEVGGGEMTAVTVNLTKQKIVPVDVSDLQAANASHAKIDSFAMNAGAALAEAVLSDILSIFTTGSFGSASVTTAAANWTVAQARAVRLALNNNRAPRRGRSLIVNTTLEDALLGSTNVLQAYAYGGAEAIREGNVPRLVGFDVYGTDVVPLNGISLAGVGCTPDAVAVAVRALLPQAQGDLEAFEIVTDEQTGLTFGYRQHYNRKDGKVYGNFECLYGYAAGLTKGASLITVP